VGKAIAPAKRDTTHSGRLFERALGVLVDGVSSPSRGRANYHPYPFFIDRGAGSRVFDVDGNEYVDVMLAYGALIHGHAHPRLVRTLQDALTRGALFASASEVEVQLAERLCSVIPGAERVRFANTGTEAAMVALRVVRGFTGKRKIIKFEGHYHGWSDAFSVSSNPLPVAALGHIRDPVRVPDSSGLTPGALEDTIVVGWNDANLAERSLRAHQGEVAAIVTEPVMANVGVIPPRPGYLQALRELANRYEALLYIDETVAGFRFAPGGAQERFNVTADIVTFGKAFGAGFPAAAIAGRADVMDVLARGQVLHYGTQNANPALLAVALESLEMLLEAGGAAFRRLDELAQMLVTGLTRRTR
jgi:glutamate-1-semialdehyde 2,1-aminomutase